MRKHIIVLAAVLAALGTAATAVAAPVTKQNGSTPAFASFTPLCGMPAFLNYGECNGDSTAFANVTGKVNAVQAKAGRYNLGISFSGLVPGESYKLFGNLNGGGSGNGFFPIGTGIADASGALEFSYQYTPSSPADQIGFDLNHLQVGNDNGGYGWTIATSYWSGHTLSVDPTTGLVL